MLRRIREGWFALPRAVRLIIANYATGAAAGATFAAALVATNAQGLRDLLLESADPWLPAGLLTAQMALTFAALSAGVAVMRIVYQR